MSRMNSALAALLGTSAGLSSSSGFNYRTGSYDVSPNAGISANVKHERCVGAETPKKVPKYYGSKKMTRSERRKRELKCKD